MSAPFNWHRWYRVHRAASRRFDRHASMPVNIRWARYDRLMDYARLCLEAYQEQPA